MLPASIVGQAILPAAAFQAAAERCKYSLPPNAG